MNTEEELLPPGRDWASFSCTVSEVAFHVLDFQISFAPVSRINVFIGGSPLTPVVNSYYFAEDNKSWRPGNFSYFSIGPSAMGGLCFAVTERISVLQEEKAVFSFHSSTIDNITFKAVVGLLFRL